MINKRKEKQLWFAVGAMIFVILVGIALIVNSFSVARTELIQEYHSHLLDIAWATDRNISNLLNRCREELGDTAAMNDAEEEHYLQTGDTTAISAHMRGIPLLQGSYVSRILVMDGTQILFCMPEAKNENYSFPFGKEEERACLCRDDTENNYLAISVSSGRGALSYVALIDLEEFYRLVMGEELSRDYWLGLYNNTSRLVMQNDARHTPGFVVEPEKAMTFRSGISTLVKCELEQKTMTQAYLLEDKKLNIVQQRLIAALPTSDNNNGVFAVAVSVESEQFFDLVQNLVWRIASYVLMTLVAVCVILSLLFLNRRKNAEIREQVALLKEQNESMQALLDKTQELAHHQRLEMIGTMTSSIAHEFNNLLTPIMGYSLMTMEKLPKGNEELFDDVAEIYEASYRAKALVSRLSSLSRKNSEATFRLLCPDAVLDKVLEVAKTSLPQRVKVVRDFHCPETCLLANEQQLAQLALNIVINAFQAMEGAQGTLTVSTRKEDTHVLLQFRDTGSGIAPEVLEHIFEPFYTTKELGRGTGLGLAIVKQTVESHNGEITVQSTLGKGTVFNVRFPIQNLGH